MDINMKMKMNIALWHQFLNVNALFFMAKAVWEPMVNTLDFLNGDANVWLMYVFHIRAHT